MVWKMSFPFWDGPFSGVVYLSFREGVVFWVCIMKSISIIWIEVVDAHDYTFAPWLLQRRGEQQFWRARGRGVAFEKNHGSEMDRNLHPWNLTWQSPFSVGSTEIHPQMVDFPCHVRRGWGDDGYDDDAAAAADDDDDDDDD